MDLICTACEFQSRIRNLGLKRPMIKGTEVKGNGTKGVEWMSDGGAPAWQNVDVCTEW